MKTSGLLYIGIGGILVYLYFNNRKNNVANQQGSDSTNGYVPYANGGLNLPQHMDLPSLTPTPSNGMGTEQALNNSNIAPLIKDETTVPAVIEVYESPLPSETTNPAPVYIPPYYIDPVLSPISIAPIAPSLSIAYEGQVPSGYYEGSQTGVANGNGGATSIISEPYFPSGSGTITGEYETNPMDFSAHQSLSFNRNLIQNPKDAALLNQCGDSFSIANLDQENSYTNYWISNGQYFMQTTSPLIRTIPVSITQEQYLKGCEQWQAVIKNAASK